MILVHEWVTGGGMTECDLPRSWEAEGCAMRRAIASDFASMQGIHGRVMVTLDARLPDDPGPWSIERIHAGESPGRILELAREADYTVLIAPETNGILADLTCRIQKTGSRILGSSDGAVALTGDKALLADHLASRGIETPPCRVINPRLGLPDDADYPAVLKPVDGAGSMDTYILDGPTAPPDSAKEMGRAILQPYVSGQPMSASFLVDSDGRTWSLAIAEQEIVLDKGRFEYRGGRVPADTPVEDRPMRIAVESVDGLAGFVGVDFIWHDRQRRATVLEINPRPTTSIVGVCDLLGPGRLAEAWLGAFEPGSRGARLLPDLAERIRSRAPISFDTSGAIRSVRDQG